MKVSSPKIHRTLIVKLLLQILTAIATEIDSLKQNVEKRFTVLESLVQQNPRG